MLGTILIAMGVFLLIGTVVAAYWLISLGCAMGGASGCEAGTVELLSDLMISNEGIFFWAAWVVGVFLVWGGMQLKGR